MKQLTRKASGTFANDYRKAYMKLLTVAASTPRNVDEFFFGPADDHDVEGEEVQSYFYGAISFGIAVSLFIFVAIN